MYAMNIQNNVIGLVLRDNCESKQVTDFIAWPSRCHGRIYCFDETFRKFINFINCPLTEKVWENPVYGTFNLYLPYAFFSACVLFI